MDHKRMGRVGEQPPRPLLPAHGGRETPAAIGSRPLEPDECGYRRNSADEAGGTMNLWPRLRSWTSAMLRRTRMEREMDEEMRFHIEAHAADLVRRGLSPQ